MVPGVSSAVAVPAYAGIPLTHRGYASSFAVITGNEAASKPVRDDWWSGLAGSNDTLVFLMGVKNLEIIAQRLMEHGKPPETPAALVRWGTRPEQHTIVAPLDRIAQAARSGNIRPPAILVVGQVVTLRERLKWYEEKPLFGHRVLITREYTDEYAPLEDLGAEVFEFPTVGIAPPVSFDEADAAIARLSTYDWLVVTSANTFRRFLERIMAKGMDVRDLKGIKVCAIGSKTAATIEGLGVRVDSSRKSSARRASSMPSLPWTVRAGAGGLNILMPRAAEARDVFPRKVTEIGGRVDAPAVYRAIKPEKHAKRLQRFMSEGRISIAAFTSGASFRNFLEIAGEASAAYLKDVAIAVIGPVTKKAVEEAGFKVSITAPKATIPAMVEEIVRWASKYPAASSREPTS